MTYVFPKGGDYELAVRFFSDDEMGSIPITDEVLFLIPVAYGARINYAAFAIATIAGFLAALAEGGMKDAR